MDEADRITVSLPFGEELRAAVERGEYPNADAAVQAAVDAWSSDRIVERVGIERLRRHWEEGLASGDPQPLDAGRLLERVEARVLRVRDRGGRGG